MSMGQRVRQAVSAYSCRCRATVDRPAVAVPRADRMPWLLSTCFSVTARTQSECFTNEDLKMSGMKAMWLRYPGLDHTPMQPDASFYRTMYVPRSIAGQTDKVGR